MAQLQLILLNGSQLEESAITVDTDTGELVLGLSPPSDTAPASKAYVDAVASIQLPANAVGALLNDGSGNLSWGTSELETSDILGLDEDLAAITAELATKLDSSLLSTPEGIPGSIPVLDENGNISSDQLPEQYLGPFNYLGFFTPVAELEYPADPASSDTYLIVEVPESGYTFVAGDLAGTVATNGDILIYGPSGWDLYNSDEPSEVTTVDAGEF